MPHVALKMISGRSEEQKRMLATELARVVVSVLGCEDESISVAIFDVKAGAWMSEVFTPEIEANRDRLYKLPGYASLAKA
ncbi:tautomerase family protein [Ancylobacter sp. VNQ12]|uniref:tautomerase family protein n=1 Tax=Ancylobacter sp. VNQ12 TaxID=3400920 RepID=UPI003C050A8E